MRTVRTTLSTQRKRGDLSTVVMSIVVEAMKHTAAGAQEKISGVLHL